MGGFDIFFILKWIVDNRGKLFEVFFDGVCVIIMNVFNLFFKDSYKYWFIVFFNFFSCFDFEEEKGFFLYKFNIR